MLFKLFNTERKKMKLSSFYKNKQKAKYNSDVVTEEDTIKEKRKSQTNPT